MITAKYELLIYLSQPLKTNIHKYLKYSTYMLICLVKKSKISCDVTYLQLNKVCMITDTQQITTVDIKQIFELYLLKVIPLLEWEKSYKELFFDI